MNLQKILSSKIFKILLVVAIAAILAVGGVFLYQKRNHLLPKKVVYQLVETTNGFPIIVNVNDTFVGNYVVQNQGYLKNLDNYYDLFLPQGSTILDIGASYGYHTVLFAKKAGKFSTIYAVEPRADVVKAMHYNMNLNKVDNVFVLNNLLYSKNVLHYMKTEPSSSFWSIVLNPPSNEEDAKKAGLHRVQSYQLDRLARNVFGVNLMRISGNGTELEIIEGAKSIIEKSPNIGIFMYWNKSAISTYSDPVDVVRQLANIGFNFWLVNENGVLKVLSVSDLLRLKSGDIIITRKSLIQQ